MAVLTDDHRKDVWADEMRQMSANQESIIMLKGQGETNVGLLDDSFETFLSTLNLRGFSSAQSLRILKLLIAQRETR